MDSDMVVVLAVLLCALICVMGLALAARCTLHRPFPSSASDPESQNSADKGLKKKSLLSLPKLAFNRSVVDGKLSECPICLSDFADGDEIRVLPECGHGFHVGCVDTWLGSHSSCPSCRRNLAATTCQMCGGLAPAETDVEAREEDANGYLP